MHPIALDYDRYVEDLLSPEDIHDANMATERAAGIGLALIVSLVMAVIHAILIFVTASGEVWVGLPLLVHVILSVVLLVWSTGQYRAGLDAPFMLLLALTTTFTGIFGAVGTILCILLYGLFRANATSFSDWFSLIFPADEFTDSEEVYNKILVGIDENPKDYDVIPFMDVMELGTEPQKQRALSKMMMKFHPRLAPAIHRGLKDESNAIRVQSATCVAKIESQFMHKLTMIEEARKKEPDNLHVLYALAKYYDDYAYTGLLDVEREALNREKAIETYKAYLQHDPNHSGAWMSIGRLLFRGGQWREAADWFQNAMQRGWTMRPMLLWQMECLYQLGDFIALRQLVREHGHSIKDEDDLPQTLRDTLALWAN